MGLGSNQPLQRRLLALLDDNLREDEVTASGLATMLAAPVSEVETELRNLTRLGNLTRRTGTNGEVRYSDAPRRKMLGDLLVDSGLMTKTQLQEALAEQARTGERLGAILLDRGYVPKQVLGKMLELQRGIPYVNLSSREIDEHLVRSLPERVIMEHKVVPLARVEGEIHLAMLDPSDIMAIDTVSKYLGGRVRPFLITEGDFGWAVTKFFDVTRKVGESLLDVAAEPHDREPVDSAAVAVIDTYDASPIVRVVNTIIHDAVRIGATDIHIEPEAEQTRVRVRVDGMLLDKAVLPRSVSEGVTSRLKVLAGMDIAERIRPQDGRIMVTIEGREYDLRIATVGTAFGERVALRLLSNRQVLVGLERLGLFPEQQELLQSLLGRQHGMILVTGPTGSGKTTTLYASVNYINDRIRNIMTIEDPIEYRLQGITQIPVREKSGITFGVGLRGLLRQDPDVVMVGEIRDAETASIAVHAALTGHLVLTTLHTNNAAGALVRLLDMSIEPYLLTSSVLAVVGQRLVRILCTACKGQYPAPDADLRILGLPVDTPLNLSGGAGCPECANLCYKGRTGVFELMVMTDAVRELVLQRKPAGAIMEAAAANGMRTLHDAIVRKVLDGVTSIEELHRLMIVEAA
jgi:type IV pilus assembly protein PilB